MRSVILAALLALAAPAASAQNPLNEQEERDPASWHLGPIRYIITGAERDYFTALETDAERLAFIDRFWKRRDTNPSTTINEYRLTFWERVVEANWRFTDSAYPGWKTDRGKIFVLLGEPSSVEDLPEFDARDQATAARGLLRWHYTNLPKSRSLDPEVIVAFVRDNRGEYTLTTDPELNDIYFDPLRPYDRPFLQELQSQLPLIARSELATAMDLGRLQAIPTEEQALHIVLTREFYGTIPARFVIYRFPTDGAGVLLTMTVILRKDDLDPPFRGDATDLRERFRLAARLIGPDEQGEQLFDTADFAVLPDPDPADPTVRFQARRTVTPGSYRVILAAFDEVGNRAATIREDLRVDSLDASAPGVSDLVLANRFRERPGAEDDPYVLGDLEIVPRGPRGLSRADNLRVYFQVSPPQLGGADVDVVYRFERRPAGADGFQPVGAPRSLRDPLGAQTWDVPLETFPAGTYRIIVEASAGTSQTVRTLEFDVSD